MSPVVVIVKPYPGGPIIAWGPFEDHTEAKRFAEFVSREIDPAVVVPLTPPMDELLAWTERVQP